VFELVDTHVHFIDQKHPRLTFSWLQPDWVHPILGNIDAMKHLVYDAAALEAESRFAGMTKCVNVQAALGTDDPVDETEWLQEMADRTGWPNGIVAYVDLASDDADAQLERHGAHANLRGIRDLGEGDYLVDQRWGRGAALLAERDLVLDLDCRWENMASARELAESLPELVIVLEHAGYPTERSDEYFQNWCAAMTNLARAENVICKISGLGMGDNRWTVDSLRPWVEHSLEVFGVARCCFGTNWPVDRLYSSYDAIVDAYRQLVASLSEAEQRQVLVSNAENVYRL
jgi:predicted TIM-barrel fold metal-dependent hydrolase